MARPKGQKRCHRPAGPEAEVPGSSAPSWCGRARLPWWEQRASLDAGRWTRFGLLPLFRRRRRLSCARVRRLPCRCGYRRRTVVRSPHLGKGLVEHLEQPAGVEVEPGRAEFESLTTHQPGQAGRQLIGARQPGPINQDRDDADVARQGGLDLQPDEVIGVIEAAPPILIGDREPLITDQRQQHIAGSDRSGDHLDEVVAQLDRVDILEDLAAVTVGQPVVQPACRVGRLLPPVTDEDPARNGCSRFNHQPDLATADPASQRMSMRTRDAAASHKVHGAPLDTTSTPHASTPTSSRHDYPSRAPRSSR